MKKPFTFLLSVAVVAAYGQGIITMPRTPSPAATVSQTIGISTVTVSYSRPAVNGREIWGNLVPYGYQVQGFGSQEPAPWRAGANENTVLTLSHEAKIRGQTVPAGSYGLFFVINEDNSGEVILSKDYKAWGSFWYDPARDQLRAPIIIRDHTMTERLTYDFINIDRSSAELVLNWEKKQFPVKIEFAVDDIVIENAREQLTNTVGFTWEGYASAANYALTYNTHLEDGLKWIDRALATTRNFTTLNTKAGLLEALGRTEEVAKLREEALTLATENELNNYGYQLLAQGKHDEAIRIFTLNTQRYPKSANVWDSLGEAYALKGDEKNAIKNFKKALSLDPPMNVKLNSEKYLRQFGAL
jgi:tetratricopeptide (TPR) repeat protein